jgi:hypothetical protein
VIANAAAALGRGRCSGHSMCRRYRAGVVRVLLARGTGRGVRGGLAKPILYRGSNAASRMGSAS